MKILLITDLYPIKDSEVNTPRTLLNFVTEWQKLGHQVKIIKPNFILNSFIRKKPFYKTGWYEDVYNVNYWMPFMGNIKNKLKEFYEKDFQPDIVIAHMPSGIIFADKLGIPFVAGVHCSDITVLTKSIYKIYFKSKLEKALNSAYKIACRSFVLQNKLTSLYPDLLPKTFVAPSGVEENFIQTNISSEIDVNNLKIVTCANLIKRKNVDKIILGLKYIKPESLVIIGDGKERKYLEKLAKTVNYPVIFLGRIPREEVFEVMKNSDIFILPSKNETFGMVYLEAMASGCITICSENDGIDGIIKNDYNGFTIKPDVEYIDAKFMIIKALGNETLEEIRKNSLETVKQYTQNLCSERYLEQIN